MKGCRRRKHGRRGRDGPDGGISGVRAKKTSRGKSGATNSDVVYDKDLTRCYNWGTDSKLSKVPRSDSG
jgi:hypothetical protein